MCYSSNKKFALCCFPSCVSGPGSSSRLCKRALYSYFLRVAQLGGHTYLLDLPTYHSVKVCVSTIDDYMNAIVCFRPM